MNQKGVLTLDFLFALLLVSGITVVVLGLSLTLVMAEASQYIAFATSRNYFGGHFDQSRQEDLARRKFANMMARPEIKKLFSGDWFSLGLEDRFDYSEEYTPSSPASPQVFFGVRLNFAAPILVNNIPLFGSTGEKSVFTAKVTSFLGREPTTAECKTVVNGRWERIKQLSSVAGLSTIDDKSYKPIDDNGC